MQPISCVITDDEPFARKGLEGYLRRIDFFKLAGVCEDALQLNSLLKTASVDLLFLDIEMPYVSGIDFLKGLSNPPKVIFTTAYEKYALQGFELDVLDYLVKPIPYERFLRAANKVYDYFRPASAGHEAYLFVKADHKLEKVLFTEIEFIESMQNYIAIQVAGKKLLTHSTLKNIQEKLPAHQFLQPHKSFLVAIEKINAIEGNVIHVNGHRIPISKHQREAVLEKIVKNKLLNGNVT